MRWILLGLLCCSLFPKISGQNISRQKLELRLDSMLQARIKPNEPGGSFLIQKGKKVLYAKSFGLADLKTGEKFSPNTLANLGSISKTFVAYGILILEKEGKLSLDDPLLQYFSDFEHPEVVKNITIRHLLTHSSGLPDIRNVDQDSVFFLTAKDAENFAPLKKAQSLHFEPGSQFEYSNPAFNGLALIIEQVSGQKWQQFIGERIFKPAGMKRSVITDGAFPENGVSHGYRFYQGKFEEYDYGEYPTFCAAGNGGVWSSVNELRKYLKAVQNCLFADCALIQKSQTVWKPSNWSNVNPPFLGYSWFVEGNPDEPANKSIGHTGSQGGFMAHLIWFPERDLSIIWIANDEEFYSTDILKALGLIKGVHRP
jgi:CubicO group peptidase (beta-lactamase class C family)